jgi:hypothetical protein
MGLRKKVSSPDPQLKLNSVRNQRRLNQVFSVSKICDCLSRVGLRVGELKLLTLKD